VTTTLKRVKERERERASFLLVRSTLTVRLASLPKLLRQPVVSIYLSAPHTNLPVFIYIHMYVSNMIALFLINQSYQYIAIII